MPSPFHRQGKRRLRRVDFFPELLCQLLSSCLADLTPPFSSVLLGLALCRPPPAPPSGSLVGYARLEGEEAACSFLSAPPPWIRFCLWVSWQQRFLHPGGGRSFLWEQLNPVCGSPNPCRTSSMAPFPQRHQPSWVVPGSQRCDSRPSCVFFHPPGG